MQALRPLILREVADAIGMHESTVSRVTSNKFIATPRGVFELKFFFTSAIAASGGGEAHSAEAVRFRIRGLIDGEPPDDTLSDEKIVELLQQRRRRDRPPHRREVPRGDAHPVLGTAPPREANGAVAAKTAA